MNLMKFSCPVCNSTFEVNPDLKVFRCNCCGTTITLDNNSKAVEIKNDNKPNNKLIICLLLMILVTIIVSIIIFISTFFNGDIKKDTLKVPTSEITTTSIESVNEKEQELKRLGKIFYEDFYWNTINYNGSKDILSKNKEEGIKVSLDNLIKYIVTTNYYKDEFDKNNINDSIPDKVEYIKNNHFSEYDINLTKVIIYPYEPFGVKDYKIDVNLEKN